MIKLKLSKTVIFSSAEIGDYAPDPPIFYEVYVNRQDGWTQAVIKFIESNLEDVDLAMSVIGLQLVSLRQGEDHHPIGSKEKVQEILDGFEDEEDGQIFIKKMAIVIYNYILNLEEERLKNSESPSTELNGIKPIEPLQLVDNHE